MVRALAWLLPAAALAACGSDDGAGGDLGEAPPVPPDWSLMAVPTEAQLLGVWGQTSSAAWAVGWEGTVLLWDGMTWNLESTTATVPLTDVAGPPDGSSGPFAVGWAGTLLERRDGVWMDAPRTTTTTADLSGVFFLDDGTGLAVGDRGTVLSWNGLTWTDADFSVISELSGERIQPRSALSGVWGAGGQWYLSGAGGASFTGAPGNFEALDTRESVPLRGVWGVSRNEVYCVGLDGLVLRLAGRWRRDAAELPRTFLFGVWGRDGADVTAVGWSGTIARRARGEWSQETVERAVDLRDVWVDAPTGFAVAVGARGTILTRTSSVTLP